MKIPTARNRWAYDILSMVRCEMVRLRGGIKAMRWRDGRSGEWRIPSSVVWNNLAILISGYQTQPMPIFYLKKSCQKN